jgi:excisionase family DNA binding protein
MRKKLYAIARNSVKRKLRGLTNSFLVWYKRFCMKLLTTKEAAEHLGISIRRVQELVKSGRLPADKFGRALVIRESDLQLVEERKAGRPKKSV